MEKLLHKRLREHTDESLHFRCDRCDDSRLLCISRKGAQRIADEIERDYIPRAEHDAEIERIVEAQGWDGGYSHGDPHRIMKTYAEAKGMPMEDRETISQWLDRWYIKLPCDSEGRPWAIGEEFTAEYDNGPETHWVEGIRHVTRQHFGKDHWSLVDDSGVSHLVENCKRPAPKVLDADDVETKVGDIVYNVLTGAEATVAEIFVGGALRWKSCSGGSGTWLSERVTHEKPVFDANGERIKVGDTDYWTLEAEASKFSKSVHTKAKRVALCEAMMA